MLGHVNTVEVLRLHGIEVSIQNAYFRKLLSDELKLRGG